MTAVFDTNILIDVLDGVAEAREELERHDAAASVMTWMEMLVGARRIDREDAVVKLFKRVRVIPLREEVAEEAVNLRIARRLKLPDAIIWATARTLRVPLITRNTRDFPESEPGIHVPYRL